MAQRAPVQVGVALKAAGWPLAILPNGIALSLCESGDGETYADDTREGDVDLQTNTWGISYGAFQIRTLKADTGTGTARDIERLRRGLVEQAKCAVTVYQSQGLAAWTVTHPGTPLYRKYVAAIELGRQVAASDAVMSVDVGDDVPGADVPYIDPDNPLKPPGITGLPNPIPSIEQIGAALAQLGDALLDPNTWRRLGLVLGGGLLALVGAAVVAAGFGRELPLPGAVGKVAKLAGA